MMTTGRPDAVHATTAFRDMVPDATWAPTGGVFVKGKGVMDTHVLLHSHA